MNKKFIIILAGVALFLFGLMIYLTKFRSPGNIPLSNNPDAYQVSITENNKAISGEVTKNKKTQSYSSLQIKQFVEMSFNTPQDILWVSCLPNYYIGDYKSFTGNLVNYNEEAGANIELKSGQANNITIICVPYSQNTAK